MIKKKEVLTRILFLLFFAGFLINCISALAVGPALVQMNFEPGMEKSITYHVFGSSANELEIYSRGDLAKYVTFDKKTIKSGDTFTATIKLPDKIETPGINSFYIGVVEKFDPELVRGNIGTLVAIEVLITIDVPYPGRYIEAHLTGYDVNINEPINFQLDLKSRGTEDLTIWPTIGIFSSDGQQKETLTLKERTIKSQEELSLAKILNTTGYNPGTYRAVAVVDYGNIAKDETSFRIGDLNIDILGYTSKLAIGKLQKFKLDVQSGWNNVIDGVYGEVVILNNSRELDRFKTTTTSLIPWENKTIEGYFDTSNYSVGFYDANITLFYFGGERGSTTSKMVKIEFIKTRSLLVWYIVGGVGLVIIIILLLLKHFHKQSKRRGR